MILKDKKATSSVNPRLDAGIKQELDVAFYLRRAFKNHSSVFVLHDVRIEHDDEHAQIDHLLVHKFGFLIIESKSIKGQVRINSEAEWSRSVGEQWTGMPSPLRQAELQLDILRRYLINHTEDLLGKILGVQMGFGGRCYNVLCAVSSDAIIDRTDAPKSVTSRLVKSEFVADAVNQVIREYHPLNFFAWVRDTRPAFSQQELVGISNFLLNGLTLTAAQSIWQEPAVSPDVQDYQTHETELHYAEPQPLSEPTKTLQFVSAQCKHCGAMQSLTAQQGRYGYYVQCGDCGKNTPLKRSCLSCSSQNTKILRRKTTFTLYCHDCQLSRRFDNLSHLSD